MKLPLCQHNKPKFCFCHFCKKRFQYRKRCFNHEDDCIDNPVFIHKIRKLNGL